MTPLRRFLDRTKGPLGVAVALLLVIPFGAGLIQTFVFGRAGDRVVAQLTADQLDAALVESVLLVGASGCGAARSVTGTAFAVEVDGRRLLITNRHIVDEAMAVGVRPLGGGPGPRVASWRLSASADVAVLELEDPDQLPPALTLSTGELVVGEPVRTVGFPGGRPFTTAGRVAAIEGGRVRLDMRVDPGASGSPVLDASGSVVGQVFARTEQGRGIGSTAGTLRAALDDLAASRSDCRDVTT